MWRKSHSEIKTNDEFDCKGRPRIYHLRRQKARWRSDGNQSPWSSKAEKDDGTEQPVVTSWGTTRESQWSFFHEKTQHDGTALSVVNEAKPRDRTGQPVVIPQRGAMPQQFIIGNDETELELSLGSTSFLNNVNDQVRKRQKKNFECYRKWRKTFYDIEHCSCLWHWNQRYSWERITQTIGIPSRIQKTSRMKQMFDISSKLVSEQDEISGLETIGWENHSWKYLSLIGEERVINLQRINVYVFSVSVLCLGKIHENPRSNIAWEQSLEWVFNSTPEYRALDRIDGELIEVEWSIYPGYNTLQLSQ